MALAAAAQWFGAGCFWGMLCAYAGRWLRHRIDP